MAGQRIVTVFGSSRPRAGEPDYEEARTLGAALARRGLAVCTGGYGGVMEGVSRGAKEAGGRTLGITAEFFRVRANAWVDEEIRVATWQERLFELVRRGHGYVACKGGTGTLVELAVVWEMLNKSVMTGKPFVVLGEFWQPILDTILASGKYTDTENLMPASPVVARIDVVQDAVHYLASKLDEL